MAGFSANGASPLEAIGHKEHIKELKGNIEGKSKTPRRMLSARGAGQDTHRRAPSSFSELGLFFVFSVAILLLILYPLDRWPTIAALVGPVARIGGRT